MNHLIDSKVVRQITHWTEDVVSLVALAAIIAVVFYAGREVIDLFRHLGASQIEDVLHSVAVIVVLVKAYRLLVYYMENHHVSIKYIIEISIIAPAVELIFAPGNRELSLNILYGVFSLANLLIYVFYYRKFCDIDDSRIKDEE